MLPSPYLVFSALEGAILDAQTDSFSASEEALAELERRRVPLILLSSRTRAEVEVARRKLGHTHPFVTENGGAVFFPDGYFNLKIPGAVRFGRYLALAFGRPYAEACEALDEIAADCQVGLVGFHSMSAREIAENTGLRAREADLARNREFEELFFFTAADDAAKTRFVDAARRRGYQARAGEAFWRFSAGCDPARAVRMLIKLFREASHAKLRAVGIGAQEEDLPWLRAVDQPILLPSSAQGHGRQAPPVAQIHPGTASPKWGPAPGPSGWNETVLNIIG